MPESSTDVRRLRLLLADDDQDDYLITRDLLRSIDPERFELEWAPNYNAALEALQRTHHDLCFFDYRLGEADGLELLREAIVRGCQAPIIMLTGCEDWATDVEAMKAGAMDFLVKSHLETKLLERSIRYALERKASEKALKSYAEEIETKNRELADALRVAREATELKSQFLANISHEIRTPMNAVLGMTDLLLGTELSIEQRDYAQTASSSAQALLDIINDLLDLSKIEAGQLKLVNTEFEPAAVVAEVTKMLSLQARSKGLDIQTHCGAQAQWTVSGDAMRLRQVLVNLIGNAIKFTEAGTVSVKADLLSCTDKAATFMFEVRDTGIGIGEDGRDRLFKPFVQENGSITRTYGGTGLGLAICRHLVEMMGGRIDFESEPGKGSRFWFTSLFGLGVHSTGVKPAPGIWAFFR